MHNRVTLLKVTSTGMVLLAAVGCQDHSEPAPDQADASPQTVPVVAMEHDAPPDRQETDPPTAELGDELAPIFAMISRNQHGAARDRVIVYLQENPESGQGEFLLGLTYHREKRYALARPHFAKATELSPRFHPTYHFFGWCLYYLGETKAAERIFQEHVQLAPNAGDSHFAIGLLAMEDDRLDEAERRFRKAIELQANNPRHTREVAKAHARLGDLYIRREQLAQAKTHLQTATDLWPQHYAAYYKLHLVLNRLGEPEAAEQAYEQYRIWQQRVEQQRGLPGQGR